MDQDFWRICFFVLGSMVGSFLNVCIVRLPQDKSIAFPASHCPKCETPIKSYDNIPIFSWLFLGGKCRSCKVKIPFRYFMVELITALTFLFFYNYYGLTILLLPYLAMMCCFIVTIFVDLEHRIIPDQVSIGGMWFGVVASLFIPLLHVESHKMLDLGGFIAGALVLCCVILGFIYPFVCKELAAQYKQEGGNDNAIKIGIAVGLFTIAAINYSATHNPYLLSLDSSVIGLIVGGGLVYLMGLLGDMMFRKESMGGGDVKLMALVGAFMGWKLAILSFFIAPFFGAIFGIIEKIRTKDSTIAYGPFLVLGALASLFYGHKIIHWIVSGGIYGQ